MIQEAQEFITQNIDLPYLLIILMAGKLFSKDEIVKPLPFWLRSILTRVGTAWRVLVISLLLGIAYFYLRRYNLDQNNNEVVNLVVTYFTANALYALLIKYFFSWVEKRLTING